MICGTNNRDRPLLSRDQFQKKAALSFFPWVAMDFFIRLGSGGTELDGRMQWAVYTYPGGDVGIPSGMDEIHYLDANKFQSFNSRQLLTSSFQLYFSISHSIETN